MNGTPARSARVPTLNIQTPEGVVFSLILAGPVTRFLAWIIDAVCVFAIYLSILYAAFGLLFVISPDMLGALLYLLYFLLVFGYSMTSEWLWRGQTLGKRLLRLRVVDHDGLRLQFSQVALRNLLRVVDSLPFLYAFGGLVSLLNGRCQRLGDIAANTVVIRTPRVREPDLKQITHGKFNSLREQPHIVARLRQQVSPAEAALALQAILRRDLFSDEARLTVFQALADRFRAHATFPEESTAGMSDEQYVRCVTDLIYTRDKREKPVPVTQAAA